MSLSKPSEKVGVHEPAPPSLAALLVDVDAVDPPVGAVVDDVPLEVAPVVVPELVAPEFVAPELVELDSGDGEPVDAQPARTRKARKW